MIYNPKAVGRNILEQVKKELGDFESEESPTLAVLRIGDNIGSISYEKSIIKLLEPLNINIKSVVLDNNISQDEFLSYSRFQKVLI